MTAARIGLFGGTFDPVHNAHLALARRALDDLGLDELRWLPAGDPWQKTSAGAAVSPAVHREAMLALAIAGEPRFVLDRREIARQGPSYTVDTVRELQRERPGAQWFLIIGQDQLAGLHTWHDFRTLLGLVTLAVAARPGAAPPADPDVAVAAMRRIALPPMGVSATEIRSRVRRGEDVGALVPPAVAGYIDRHRLYQEPARDQREVATLKPFTPPAAPRRGPVAPRSAARALMDIRKLQRAIVDGLEDVKAQHIVVFNTEHLSPLFERVIIASGTSNRQTKALASSVRESVKDRGFPVPRMEGEENGEWIIVDCGAAVAHIMQPAIREYYRLEEIWGDKPVRMKIERGASAAAPAKRDAERPAAAPARKSASKPTAASAKPAAAKPPAAPAKQAAARAAAASSKKPAARRAGAADPGRSRRTAAKPASGRTAAAKAGGPRSAEGRAPKNSATRAAAPRATAPAGGRTPAKKAAQPSTRKTARTPRS